jgi:hypothetical protein
VIARLRPWLPLVVVFLLLALLYPEPIFRGWVYGAADAAASDAFRQVGDAARSDGDYPLWNPYIFGGMPTFGSLAYTYGVYPPTVVFEALQALGLPPLTWLFGHLVFGGLGVWWLLGRWDVPWPVRLLACVAFLWFARVVAWSVHGHGSKLGAAMYMPWLLGLTWQVLTRGQLRAVALAAVLLGLQFLRGHVQISYYTLLLLGGLTVWHLFWPLDGTARGALAGRARRAGLMALVVVLGFGIGAALLLPVHEYAEISTRGAGGASGGSGTAYDYATSWSLAPEDLAALVVPTAAGFGKATYLGRMPFTDYPNYLGPLLLLLAAAAWLSRPRSLVAALTAASVLAILVGMGRFSPGLYQLLYEGLPYFDKFRVPSMILVIPALCVATLAALGAATLAGAGGERTRWLRRLALVALGLGAVMALAAGVGAGAYRDGLAALAERSGRQAAPVILDAAVELHRALVLRQGLVLLAAGGALLVASRREAFRGRWLLPALVVLVAIDLGSVARLVTHPERSLVEVARTADGGGRLVSATPLVHPWREAAAARIDDRLAGVLEEVVGHDRVLPLGNDAQSNAYMVAGIRSLGGYHPAKPAAAEAIRARLFGRLPAGELARWLGAAAITYPGELPAEALALLRDHGLDLVSPGTPAGGTIVYPVADVWPRARLTDRWQPAGVLPAGDALEPFLDAVIAGEHDLAAGPVLLQEPDPRPQTGAEPLPRPRFVRDGLDEIVLSVATPRPALLLLADLWAPGWSVAVNGEEAALLRADLALRAVALPAGEHEVRFTYHDPALGRGLGLAAAAVVGVLILLALAWRRGRPTAAAGNPASEDAHGPVG